MRNGPLVLGTASTVAPFGKVSAFSNGQTLHQAVAANIAAILNLSWFVMLVLSLGEKADSDTLSTANAIYSDSKDNNDADRHDLPISGYSEQHECVPENAHQCSAKYHAKN
jgi:hypothetical protein